MTIFQGEQGPGAYRGSPSFKARVWYFGDLGVLANRTRRKFRSTCKPREVRGGGGGRVKDGEQG